MTDKLVTIRVICKKCEADQHEDCHGKTEDGNQCFCETRHPFRKKKVKQEKV